MRLLLYHDNLLHVETLLACQPQGFEKLSTKPVNASWDSSNFDWLSGF